MSANSNIDSNPRWQGDQLVLVVDDEPGMCSLCQNTPPYVLLYPCKHHNICGGCWNERKDPNSCPTCHAFVTKSVIGISYELRD